MTIIKTEYEYGLINTRTQKVEDYTYGYPDYLMTTLDAYYEAKNAKADWERDTGDRYEIVCRAVKRGAWVSDL